MLKEYETRAFSPTVKTLRTGDRLAIQAGAADTPKLRDWWMANVKRTGFGEAFAAAGISDWCDLPFGKIIGHVRFDGAFRSEDVDTAQGLIDACERQWGIYGPGRVAWRMNDPVKLATLIPCRGHQSLFQAEVPHP